MAPLPPSSTPRYRVHYTTCGKQHTFQMRSHQSPTEIGILIQDFLTALDAVCFASIIDFVDFAADNSDIFNSVTTDAESFTWGTGIGSVTNVPNFMNFIGRSTGGKRVRIAVFGLDTSAVDYRFIAGENADVDNGNAVLTAAGDILRCIDDLQPVWKSYVNAGVNAYWQKAVRP